MAARRVAAPTLALGIGAIAVSLAFIEAAAIPEASACGCFAQSNPATPVVQGGERIVFSMEDGEVTAHIQIQYDGQAEDFAWLVPLPAEPTLELGTDELFTNIIRTTQPRYTMVTNRSDACDGPPLPSLPPPPPPPPPVEGGPGIVVERDTVGPYDYAVLRADDQQILLDWLNQEGFFVPAGTDETLTPYIRPGAFFLALKLRTGAEVGELQPVVIKYRSELPQIPIVLTSVGANPDMPVLVWVLGEHRAIPRNFFHTKINDALIDWTTSGSNYVEVVTDAVDEAEGHHSFVTEYAGSSDPMVGVIDFTGRFGDRDELAATTEPAEYLNYLSAYQFVPFNSSVPTSFLSILRDHLPVPQEVIDTHEEVLGYEFIEAQFYFNYGYYVSVYNDLYDDLIAKAHADFDPVALTDALYERIVTPTIEAGAMFRDNPYMTRLFTTLSPDEMTKDPVFSFNPDLPEVSNVHVANAYILTCEADGTDDFNGPTLLVTEQGWRIYYPNGVFGQWEYAPLPASGSIEILREEGMPEVVTDNRSDIAETLTTYEPPWVPEDPTVPVTPNPNPDPDPMTPDEVSDSGCNSSPGGTGGFNPILLLGLAIAFAIRRRRVRA